MRIQFCSDLHLDFNPHKEFNELLTPVAPVLALLGDIGDPESKILADFLDWCCRFWEQVLYIPGNHEFWRMLPGSTKTIDSAMKDLHTIAKRHKNLMICWRQKLVSEDGVTILATPLWSRPAEGVIPHEQEKAWIDSDRTFDNRTLSALHEADLRWIVQECKSAKNKLVVILTHYAPSLMLIDRKEIRSPDVTLYASDLDVLIRPPIVAWACGHIHQAVQWLKGWETATGESGTVLITTNPYGYPRDRSAYRTDAVLRIDPSAIKTPNVDECLSGMNCKTLG